MSDNAAKVLSVTAIWVSTALIFTFGVFDFSWKGPEAVFLMLIISLVICGAACFATWTVCKSFAKPVEDEHENTQLQL